LPPLPPLLAPPRMPTRSRSVASLSEAKKEPLQRGAPLMFRTAPLPVSGDRDGGVNMSPGPAPPSLAPPPQPQRQQPPPPPQRQPPKDDPSGVRLAPKLLAAADADRRHRSGNRDATQTTIGRVESSAVCEGWCDVDARLSSARLQSVV
jgi:hypothetical protein